MSDPPSVKRPAVVAVLYAFCVLGILFGLIALAGGFVMVVSAHEFDSEEPEDFMVYGGVAIIMGGVLAVIHAVPLFLKRSDRSWRIILGFLIAYLAIWGLYFFPFLVFPAVLIALWLRQNVRDYYGFIEEWDRPERDRPGFRNGPHR